MQYTISIFELLASALPPLVPDRLSSSLEQAVEAARRNPSLTLEDLEDAMIIFGKKIWPYKKAFEEWVDMFQGKLGEKFFVGRMDNALKARYRDFESYGGTWRDAASGASALFFSAQQRHALGQILVDALIDVKGHARQAIMSIDRERYEERVAEFKNILDDIENRLSALRRMADEELDYPELAVEIRSQARSFEHGLCLLGPPHSFEAICKAEEHFIGRRIEKNLHKSLEGAGGGRFCF